MLILCWHLYQLSRDEKMMERITAWLITDQFQLLICLGQTDDD